ncbi:hypothetical protein ABZZ79_34925 [Streptomyces sp. NPDC006458]|uniref:hypothetical protein n=1 Tax=Streptomyces TaxID=1883 RepID=UPI0033A827DC
MSIVRRIAAAFFRRETRTEQLAPDAEHQAVLPTVEQIEQAAADYREGAELARRGDALKRRAKKVLGELPDGTYGTAVITRKPNAPIADKNAVVAQLRDLGEEVPMMQRAATLVVEIIETPAETSSPAASEESDVLDTVPVDWVDEIFTAARPAALLA